MTTQTVGVVRVDAVRRGRRCRCRRTDDRAGQPAALADPAGTLPRHPDRSGDAHRGCVGRPQRGGSQPNGSASSTGSRTPASRSSTNVDQVLLYLNEEYNTGSSAAARCPTRSRP